MALFEWAVGPKWANDPIAQGIAAGVVLAVLGLIGRWLWMLVRWLREKCREWREPGLLPTERWIKGSIQPLLGQNLDLVTEAIKTSTAIRKEPSTLWQAGGVVFTHRFYWCRLVSDAPQVFRGDYRKIGADISSKDIDFCFYIAGSEIFAKETGSSIAANLGSTQGSYSDRDGVFCRKWMRSPEGARIIFLETTLYSNVIIEKAIEYLKNQGCSVVGSWALFDARCEGDRLAEVNGVPVKAAYRIDLGLIESHNFGDRNIKTLSYDQQ